MIYVNKSIPVPQPRLQPTFPPSTSDLFPVFPIFACSGEIFSHKFTHGFVGYRVNRFAEKTFLFDIFVVFIYIVVQTDNLNI